MNQKTTTLHELTLSCPECEERSWELFALGIGGIESVNETTVKCFLDLSSAEVEELINKAADLGFNLVDRKEISKENWVAKFEELLTPFTVGRLTVRPVRDADEGKALSPSPNQLVLIPGMGFGTGHHPTTRMLLEFMQDKNLIPTSPKFVLDVGTGSGILALGMSKLFPSSLLYAFDNDPIAIDNAIENGSLNNPHQVTFHVEELKDSYQQTPDLLIANIYAEVLIHLEPQFSKVLQPGGLALLSGITKEASETLKNHFKKNGWVVAKEELRGEWYAIAVRSKSPHK